MLLLLLHFSIVLWFSASLHCLGFFPPLNICLIYKKLISQDCLFLHLRTSGGGGRSVLPAASNQSEFPPTGFTSLPELAPISPLSKMTQGAWEADSRFPCFPTACRWPAYNKFTCFICSSESHPPFLFVSCVSAFSGVGLVPYLTKTPLTETSVRLLQALFSDALPSPDLRRPG